MAVLIQYEGFVVVGMFRVYNFQVIDAPGETRQFNVKVPSESFRSSLLKFQDGPPLSFERVKREIDGETEELHAKPQLNIDDPEIQEYLVRHYPPKALKKGPPHKVSHPGPPLI